MRAIRRLSSKEHTEKCRRSLLRVIRMPLSGHEYAAAEWDDVMDVHCVDDDVYALRQWIESGRRSQRFH